MKSKTPFKKHSPKLSFEAILKSLINGLTVGFATSFVASLITWFMSINSLIVAICTFTVVATISTLLFYFIKFRTSVLSNARKLDSLGLEERLVTMIEHQNDDSYMAQIQRADAEAALSKLDTKQIKFSVSKKLISALIVFAVLASSMVTVTVVGPSGIELLEQIMPEQMIEYLEVTYLVEEGGEIVGESDQLVAKGEHAEPVLAVAEDGYEFIGWDDGETRPARNDRNVVDHIVVMAVFERIEEGVEGDDEGDDEGDESGEDESGEPSGEGNSESPEDQQPENENPSDSKDGGGKYDDNNQIIDGKTYYREHLASYKALIEEYLKEHGDNLTEEQKAIILAYIGIV